MLRRPRALVPILVAAVALLALPFVVQAQTPAAGPVEMEWLGWSHFRFTQSNGAVALTNPFTANPDSPIKAGDIKVADLIFVADGHGDEVGSTVEIAQATGATVFAPGELGSWIIEQGVPRAQVIPFAAPGERIRVKGMTARMVSAVHSSGLPKPSATVPYGGIAAGVVITFDNGFTVYFAGSSAATADQALVSEMYKPHLAIFHMGNRHDPTDFAMQAKLLKTYNPNLRMVMPHHHRAVQPAGATTVEEVQAEIGRLGVGVTVVAPEIGTKYKLAP